MKHKIVFTDMDGTLYQTTEDVVQKSTIAALKKMQADGALVCAATGRPLSQMKSILNNLDGFQFDEYVLINGGYNLDKDFRIISSSPIRDDIVEKMVEFACAHHIGLMFHFGDVSVIYNNFYQSYNFMKYTNGLEALIYDPTCSYHHRHPAYNCIMVAEDPELVKEFVRQYPELRLDLINVKTDAPAFDIFDASNDKSRGIEQILEKKGFTWDDVIAFGDSTNDVQMLTKADMGIAMGSAIPEVQACANHVTTDVFHDGIANAVDWMYQNDIA